MSKQRLVNAYLRGQISRRVFVRRLVMSGISVGAAASYADLLVARPAAAEDAGTSGVPSGPSFYPDFVYAYDFYFSPQTLRLKAGRRVQWEFQGPTPHSASETAMELFDSGPQPQGSAFGFTFDAAGTYPFVCEDPSHNQMSGVIHATMRAKPLTGPASSPFRVTWAAKTAYFGFVYDVQLKGPNDSGFFDYITGTESRSVTFTPGIPGTYRFRARLRRARDGRAADWSPVLKIEAT